MGVTSIRLQPDIETPLEALAKRLDRSKNYLINQAIREFIERQSEEERRWRETMEAIQSVQSGRRFEEAEVSAWLEGWGTGNESGPPKG